MRSSQKRIRVAFWLLALIPVFLGMLAFRAARTLVDSSQDVAHRNETVRELQDLLSKLKDVEVSQREFVLTGIESYLAPYKNGKSLILAEAQELKKRAAGERVWLEHLDVLIEQKFEEMEKIIRLRREVGFEAASTALLANNGTTPMDDIKTVFRNMMKQENASLSARTADQERSFTRASLIFGAAMLLNVVLITVLWAGLHREELERQQKEQAIRQSAAELERRVELRTEALSRSNEDLQQFAYIASHDLQEPLRAVSNYTALLERRYKGQLDPDADVYIEFISDGTRRMTHLIKNLLDYSKAGEVAEGNLPGIQTEEILSTVLSNLKVTISEAKAVVTHDPLPEVSYDPMRLTQIFQNLIGNALKYRGVAAPRVHIAARRDDQETVFSVKDNGMGIEAQYLERIFGIFQRLHGKEVEGTGIGLAMCKKVVDRLGGRIWVESSPGEGSTFFFTIPNQPAGQAADAAAT